MDFVCVCPISVSNINNGSGVSSLLAMALFDDALAYMSAQLCYNVSMGGARGGTGGQDPPPP